MATAPRKKKAAPKKKVVARAKGIAAKKKVTPPKGEYAVCVIVNGETFSASAGSSYEACKLAALEVGHKTHLKTRALVVLEHGGQKAEYAFNILTLKRFLFVDTMQQVWGKRLETMLR